VTKLTLTAADFDADWLTIEIWANQVSSILSKPILFIPRKSSTKPDDLTVNWHAIENWANSL
jgi:hypothetical protein